MVAEGLSHRKISAALARADHTTARGKPYAASAIQKIIGGARWRPQSQSLPVALAKVTIRRSPGGRAVAVRSGETRGAHAPAQAAGDRRRQRGEQR
jgi:hypothetical protein